MVVNKDTNNRVTEVQYVNPMGYAIADKIKSVVMDILQLPPTFVIKNVFDPGNHPQTVRIVLDSPDVQHTEGNDYDCGPFLVYALSHIVLDKPMISFANITENKSMQLGQVLREQLTENKFPSLSTPAKMQDWQTPPREKQTTQQSPAVKPSSSSKDNSQPKSGNNDTNHL